MHCETWTKHYSYLKSERIVEGIKINLGRHLTDDKLIPVHIIMWVRQKWKVERFGFFWRGVFLKY